jgi:hypothetical protein
MSIYMVSGALFDALCVAPSSMMQPTNALPQRQLLRHAERKQQRRSRHSMYCSGDAPSAKITRMIEPVTGRYFVNCKPKRSSERSYDEATGARLWRVSADLVGLQSAA